MALKKLTKTELISAHNEIDKVIGITPPISEELKQEKYEKELYDTLIDLELTKTEIAGFTKVTQSVITKLKTQFSSTDVVEDEDEEEVVAPVKKGKKPTPVVEEDDDDELEVDEPVVVMDDDDEEVEEEPAPVKAKTTKKSVVTAVKEKATKKPVVNAPTFEEEDEEVVEEVVAKPKKVETEKTAKSGPSKRIVAAMHALELHHPKTRAEWIKRTNEVFGNVNDDQSGKMIAYLTAVMDELGMKHLN